MRPELTLITENSKKVYFASDFHLGLAINTPDQERQREAKIVQWLEVISSDAVAVFLVGDIFDFWFDYKHVVPGGFVRFQAKVAELVDHGILVYFFTGNHDLWMFGYHERELGVKIFQKPIEVQINNHRFLIGHGDGLGPGDSMYKILKRIFTNRVAQWVFRWLHPDVGIALARSWSGSSRLSKSEGDERFMGEKEYLTQYCREMEQKSHHDYYVFGHRHLPLEIKIGENSTYINLGEWFRSYTYGVYDGTAFKLLSCKD
jgi:UDP-2,3-diacylglucosamine hydrolase